MNKAVGQAFLRTAMFSGAALGPLLVGFLQEATGDLRLCLFVSAFFILGLITSGLLLKGPSPSAAVEARAS